LICAGLLVKALWRIQAVDPGFRADGVLTLRTALPMPKYRREIDRTLFYNKVLSEARTLPGVTSASYISFLPMVMRGGIWPIKLPGMSDEASNLTKVSLRFVTPDFFGTLKIPLRSGRDVAAQDAWKNQPFVAVVSESFARRYWPNQDPLGRHFEIAFFDRVVVGVVADISVRGLEATSEPQVYLSSQQMPNGGVTWFSPKDLVVRASSDASALNLAPALRRIIHDADPEQAVADVQLLSDVVASDTAPRRTQLGVLWAFTITAFLLAAVGIHGLLSFAVSTRMQEVGVRLALGATPGHVLRMFLGQGLTLGGLGVLVALPIAYAAATAMRTLLFGVEPGDPWIYAAGAGLALLMRLLGSFRPAWRAAGVDPAITMRTE
jgi:predicted permease